MIKKDRKLLEASENAVFIIMFLLSCLCVYYYFLLLCLRVRAYSFFLFIHFLIYRFFLHLTCLRDADKILGIDIISL